MFKFIFLMLLSIPCFADSWTSADTNRETAYLIVDAMDWAQTRTIARNPDKYFETNPILGKHPSVDRVDAYFVSAALLHIAISKALPSNYRAAWQYISIGYEANYVSSNLAIGISIKF